MSQKNPQWNRRQLLRQLSATVALGAIPARLLYAAEGLRFRDDPFTLGVASGYPTPQSVVLWTRLALKPRQPGGGLPADAVVPVKWEIATDDRMKNIVREGVDYATAEWAHSIHAEPGGLEPGRDYWYRFTAGGQRSPIGRTRTAPRAEQCAEEEHHREQRSDPLPIDEEADHERDGQDALVEPRSSRIDRSDGLSHPLQSKPD